MKTRLLEVDLTLFLLSSGWRHVASVEPTQRARCEILNRRHSVEVLAAWMAAGAAGNLAGIPDLSAESLVETIEGCFCFYFTT